MTKVDLYLASEVIVKNNKRIAWMSCESSFCSEIVNKPNQRVGVVDLLKAKVTLTRWHIFSIRLEAVQVHQRT